MPAALLTTLAHTPLWVYAVFAALLALGLAQRRDRTLSRTRLLLLPFAMAGLSLFGVLSSFGLQPYALLLWVLGLAGFASIGTRLLRCPAQRTPGNAIRVRGSDWPLVLMMAIFCIKYLAGYISARQLAVGTYPGYIGTVSLCLGLLSGAFVARARAAYLAANEDGPRT